MSSADAVRQSMTRHGIDRVALISELAASGDVAGGNAQTAAAVQPAAGLYGYVVLNAGYPDEAQAELSKYMLKAAFVAGVLVGNGQRPPTLSEARDILAAHRRYTKPMALLAPDADAVHAAREMAAEFATMKFLLLGMGGDDWRTAVAAARQQVNIFLEMSGVSDADKVSFAVSALSPRRLLFGSGQPHGDPQAMLALVNEARALASFDRPRLLDGNAQALFHVTE